MHSIPAYIAGCQGVGDSWTRQTPLLGRVKRLDFIIDTKILWKEASIRGSLEKLGVSKIDTLFVHAPDSSTPLAEQAANFDIFYRDGLFSKLGLCNYSPETLSEWLAIASDKKDIKPSVFQGQYNVLYRHYETTLFPLLREHGIPFIVTSPLAGGFLTGNVTFAETPRQLDGTRFGVSEGNMLRPLFRGWYDKPGVHNVVKRSRSLQGEYGVSSLAEPATRWLLFHSEIGGTDAVAMILQKNLTLFVFL
ncbi:NADP-dependent oxidoreductase domain-containing protein [Aspergillus cavernicola]|uniref:NADP-dependent oxidoreductase domain-containing protein n=1 Tax=Aspergillus cavernicola TaxID=176166 RepID=A0ABR4IMK3_9EURO